LIKKKITLRFNGFRGGRVVVRYRLRDGWLW